MPTASRKRQILKKNSRKATQFFWCQLPLQKAKLVKFGVKANLVTPLVLTRGLLDPDFRTRIRQDSAHFEQTGSDPDYGFIQVSGSGSGFSNIIVLGLDANTIIKTFLQRFKGCNVVSGRYSGCSRCSVNNWNWRKKIKKSVLGHSLAIRGGATGVPRGPLPPPNFAWPPVAPQN